MLKKTLKRAIFVWIILILQATYLTKIGVSASTQYEGWKLEHFSSTPYHSYHFSKNTTLQFKVHIVEEENDFNINYDCEITATGYYDLSYGYVQEQIIIRVVSSSKDWGDLTDVTDYEGSQWVFETSANANADPWLNHRDKGFKLTNTDRTFLTYKAKGRATEHWDPSREDVFGPNVWQFFPNIPLTIYSLQGKQLSEIREEFRIAEYTCDPKALPVINLPVEGQNFGNHPYEIPIEAILPCRFLDYSQGPLKFETEVQIKAYSDEQTKPASIDTPAVVSAWTSDEGKIIITSPFSFSMRPLPNTDAKESYGIDEFRLYYEGNYRIRVRAVWPDEPSEVGNPQRITSNWGDWRYFSVGPLNINPEEATLDKLPPPLLPDQDIARARAEQNVLTIAPEKAKVETPEGFNPEKARALSPAATPSKKYALTGPQLMSPMQGKKYQAVLADGEAIPIATIPFQIQSPVPIEPKFQLSRQTNKIEYENWSGVATKKGEDNYYYESAKRLNPGVYHLRISYEDSVDVSLFFEVAIDANAALSKKSFTVDTRQADIGRQKAAKENPDISDIDKKELIAKVPAESSQMSGSGTVVPIDPEKAKILSPAAESSLKAYTVSSNQVVSPVDGRKYQAITKDSENTSSVDIPFLVRSPQPVSPNFILKKRIFKEPFKNYEDWSGDASKMGESNNYQYETTRSLGPGEYQLLTSFEPGKNKLIYFRILGDLGDDDIESIERMKSQTLIDQKPALASLVELQLVSPEANKSYSSSELPGASDDAPPLYPVLIKAICPIKTHIGIELKKRLSMDSSYHTVRTWHVDMTKLKKEAGGYSYEMTRPLGAGNYYLEVSGSNENLKNYNQPIKRYFRVLGDSKQLLEVAEEQNPYQKVQNIIIEPRKNQIYSTFQQDKVQFVYWLKLPYSSPVRMRIKKDSEVVLSETLTASDGGGKKEYRGNKQMPAGVYTIEVMPTNTAASGQVDASGQTKYIAGQWTGPVTFYLGSSEMAQRNGDSKVSGSLKVTPDRSAIKQPSPIVTQSPRTAPALVPLPRGVAFSVNSLTSLPVKHAAGKKPVYEFEYYDGRAWRKERSIRSISMQTPQGNGMTQVITKASFRISKPGKYRYRVKTDASGSPSSPYQEFVVVDPRAQSMAQVSAQSQASRAKTAADPAAAGPPPSGAVNVAKSPAKTAQPRPPDNSADSATASRTKHQQVASTQQVPKQRRLMPPSIPPKITAPRPNQSFSAPAKVMVKTSHDSRFALVFEMSKDMGKPLIGKTGDFKQLPPGKYRIKVGYKGRPQRSHVDFLVKMPIKKQAVKTQAPPQEKKQAAKTPAPKPTSKPKLIVVPQKSAN